MTLLEDSYYSTLKPSTTNMMATITATAVMTIGISQGHGNLLLGPDPGLGLALPSWDMGMDYATTLSSSGCLLLECCSIP